MRSKTITATLAVLLAVGLTLTGAVGTVAAGHADGSDDVLIHTNTTASDDVTQVWVDVTGAESINTVDNTTTVNVTVEGVNGSNSTELHSETLTVEEATTASSTYDLADADSDDYDDLRITAEAANGTGQYINESETEWGTLVENVGGGGGFLSGNGALGGGVGILAIIGVGYFFLKED